jgi:glucose/arabinose dehydrogenase
MFRHIISRELLAMFFASGLLLVPSAAQATVSPSFTDSLVASVPTPTALAFTPDGRLLVTSQTGTLNVVKDGVLLSTPALTLASICTNSERGLLGVATDPSYASNHFVYLYYTAAVGSGCVNRVSRFVLSDSSTVDPAGEKILLDNIPSPAGNHNGGDVHFGRDGYLYVSVGDGGCDYDGDSGCGPDNAAARDLNVLLGKVLRITSDGGIPTDNPFVGSNSARCNVSGRTDPGKICQETYAWGFRNPFRLAFDPNAVGTRFYINDVGQSTWEEIDAAQAGADYGWNVREGFCATGSTTDCGAPPTGTTNPIYAYGHEGSCDAITAGAFVPDGVWPGTYDGAYLFADYLCGKIWQLVPSGNGFTASEFASDLGVGGPISMIFGPAGTTQALYYTTYANGGQVRRIELNQQTENHAPTASLVEDVTSGPAPLTVQFDGSGSSDPDSGDTLTYMWNFGDGTQPSETTSANVSHVYADTGTFTATLTVRDNHGATSTPVSAEIQVGSPLTPPQNLVAPEVTGMLRVENTLSANSGIWTGTEPLDLGYQWLRCSADGDPCVPVPGATESEYLLVSDDFGSSIRVVITGTNGAGSTIATSLPTDRIKHQCRGESCTAQSG